jgi:predicted NBD/HSP70 family sugar kinase
MYLLFDIGGTKMRLAVCRDGEGLDDEEITFTPHNFEKGIAEFKETAEKVAKGERIKKAIGGIAGTLNPKKSELVSAPNLPNWIEEPLKGSIEHALQAPTTIENDAALGALGEATHGAGKGYEIVAYLTISTGVGGARIVDGEIDEHAYGFEPGYQIVQVGGERKSLEDLVSGTALEKKHGKKPAEITDEKVWDETAHWLALGLNDTIVHWSPHIVVLGGSMMTKEVGIPIEKVREYVAETLRAFPKPPKIVVAERGDQSGLYGALELARRTP